MKLRQDYKKEHGRWASVVYGDVYGNTYYSDNYVEWLEEKLESTYVEFSFSCKELEYMLVMLTEGQDKVNSSEAFEGFQNYQLQEIIIDKVRKKCWECSQKKVNK